jgi:arsenate reductase (thioredoxin)
METGEAKMNRAERAIGLHQGGLNCSQAVFSSFAESLGMDHGLAVKLATGFGGGMGRTGGACGAVTGAILVLGLKHGSATGQDQEAKANTYRLVREFLAKFKERNGSIVCRELLGCDIGTPEGFESAKRDGLLSTVCNKAVRDAVEILEEILQMPTRLKVLFLCTGNSCRSQMAEGWARALKSDVIEAYSAGIETHGLNPRAVKVMAEAGVDISGHRSKRVEELDAVDFDVVVTVCGHANETCPAWLKGKARVVHAGFDDPPALAKGAKTDEEALGHYRRVRDEIRLFVQSLPLRLGFNAKEA